MSNIYFSGPSTVLPIIPATSRSINQASCRLGPSCRIQNHKKILLKVSDEAAEYQTRIEEVKQMDLRESGHDQAPMVQSISHFQLRPSDGKTSIATEFSKLQQRIHELKAKEQLIKIKQIQQAGKIH